MITNASKPDTQVLDEFWNIDKDKRHDLYGYNTYGGEKQLKIIAEKR